MTAEITLVMSIITRCRNHKSKYTLSKLNHFTFGTKQHLTKLQIWGQNLPYRWWSIDAANKTLGAAILFLGPGRLFPQ